MAAEELGGKARWHPVDTAHQASIDAFFDQIEVLHGLFTTAATYVTGSIAALSVEQAATPFESKFWGQYRVVKSALPKLSSDASVVLMSGAASVRPAGSAPAYVAANAAIEGLARGLAHELAPIRVNALSPAPWTGTYGISARPRYVDRPSSTSPQPPPCADRSRKVKSRRPRCIYC